MTEGDHYSEERLKEHQSTFTEFADEVTAHYRNLIAKASTAPKDAWEHWEAFSAAIDWSERWIIGLIGMEVALLVIVLVLWKSYELQAAIFLFLCALIAFSERINSFCAEHWGSFATQNYFDVHGAFAITLFSGPLLFIMFTQLVIFLRLTSSELIKAKRMELKIKYKKEKTANIDSKKEE